MQPRRIYNRQVALDAVESFLTFTALVGALRIVEPKIIELDENRVDRF